MSWLPTSHARAIRRGVLTCLSLIIGIGYSVRTAVASPLPLCSVFIDTEASTRDWSRDTWLSAAESLARFAEREGLAQCIPAEKAIELLSYYDEEALTASIYRDLDHEIDRAKEHWFNLEFEEALALTDHALLRIDQAARAHQETGAAWQALGAKKVHVLLVKALVLKALERKKDVERVFAEALAIHPHLTVDELEFPPSYRKRFAELQNKRLAEPSGTLSVKSEPQAADVYVNGISYGSAPISIPKIPAGPYTVSVTANHYHVAEKNVDVVANAVTESRLTLNWKSLKPHDLSLEENPLFIHGIAHLEEMSVTLNEANADVQLLAAMKEAIKKGEILHSDRLFLLREGRDASGAANGTLEVRVIDTALKASYRPIAIPLEAVYTKNRFDWKAMRKTLSAVMAEDLGANPGEALDPRTGELTLLKKKKPFYRRPAFWVGVGVAVVGGTVGGILASRHGDGHGGSSSGDGSVEVGLDGF